MEVIKFLSETFGERIHERDNDGYTMLHWAAQGDHCKVARYLIEDMQMDPQDRDKVCGVEWVEACPICLQASFVLSVTMHMTTNYV